MDAHSGNANQANYMPQVLESTAYGAAKMIYSPPTSQSLSSSSGSNNFSAIPAVASLIDYTVYHKPVSSTEYVADVIHHFGVAQPAYAQGIGFAGLQPVLTVWKAFRNLAYFLYVIIFVVVGFMIMFRAKLNPQTVVSLQIALPNLVFTLILITFSYAIAGFVVDLIYLSIYIFGALFQMFGLIKAGPNPAEVFLGKNIFEIGWIYLFGSGDVAGVAAQGIGVIVQDVLVNVAGWLSSVLAFLILAIALLIAIVRTFFMLLKAYINIILKTVLAPLFILLNAMPGSDAFSSWLKDLVASAAVFPATALILLLGIVLVGSPANANLINAEVIKVEDNVGYSGAVWRSQQDQVGFVPPLVLPGNVGTADALQAIIGLSIIMLLPETLEIIRAQLGVKDEVGKLAEKNLGVVNRAATGAGGIVLSGFLQRAGQDVGPAISSAVERIGRNVSQARRTARSQGRGQPPQKPQGVEPPEPSRGG